MIAQDSHSAQVTLRGKRIVLFIIPRFHQTSRFDAHATLLIRYGFKGDRSQDPLSLPMEDLESRSLLPIRWRGGGT